MATGARLCVDALIDAGVEVVFGLPGVHNLTLWRAAHEVGLRIVGVRHEQAAAAAADGYARATGRLGVAFTTTGPGAANAVGATGEAWASGSPILVIATDIPTTERREGVHRGVLHETNDQAAFFVPVTKATVRVKAANEVYAAAQLAAFHAADTPARPVYLEIPTDVLAADAGPERLEAEIADQRDLLPDVAALDAAAALLAEAQRPLIWVGGGAAAAQAGPEVAMIAERIGAPVVETFTARDLIGADHPLAVGLPPHLPAVGGLWDDADCVLVVGSELDAMTTQGWRQPTPPRMVNINIVADATTKAYPADVALVGDAAQACAALVGRLDDTGRMAAAVAQVAEARSAGWADLEERYGPEVDFVRTFGDVVGHDTTVLADMCIPGYWLGALHHPGHPRQIAYPVGWGTLGFAFPASVGAGVGARGPVVSVSGDGGFLFATGELATLVQERIPTTTVVIDDGGYGMLRADQGDDPLGTELVTPDFEAVARGFNMTAETVDGLGEEFADALARQLAADEPTLLCAKASLRPPPTTSPFWYRKAAGQPPAV